MMKLLGSLTSPYVRKVRVCAFEKNLADQIEFIVRIPFQDPEDLKAANPLGRVPALLREDGPPLYDSRVICAYLDRQSSGVQPLIPGGAHHWDTLRREALSDGILDNAVAVFMERQRPEGQQSEALIARRRQQIQHGLAVMAQEVPALPGDLTLGHIAFACALGYLTLRMPDIEWRAEQPELARFFDGFAARPSMQATAPVT